MLSGGYSKTAADPLHVIISSPLFPNCIVHDQAAFSGMDRCS